MGKGTKRQKVDQTVKNSDKLLEDFDNVKEKALTCSERRKRTHIDHHCMLEEVEENKNLVQLCQLNSSDTVENVQDESQAYFKQETTTMTSNLYPGTGIKQDICDKSDDFTEQCFIQIKEEVQDISFESEANKTPDDFETTSLTQAPEHSSVTAAHGCFIKQEPGQNHPVHVGTEDQRHNFTLSSIQDESVSNFSDIVRNNCSQNVDNVGETSHSTPFVSRSIELYNEGFSNVEPIKEEPEVLLEESPIQEMVDEQIWGSSSSSASSHGENISTDSKVNPSTNTGSNVECMSTIKVEVITPLLLQKMKHPRKIENLPVANSGCSVTKEKYTCSECTYSTNNVRSLSVHLRTHLTGGNSKIATGIFECSQCSYSTFNIDQFLSHNDWHLNKCSKYVVASTENVSGDDCSNNRYTDIVAPCLSKIQDDCGISGQYQTNKFLVNTSNPSQCILNVEYTGSIGPRKLKYHCSKCDYRTGNNRDFAHHCRIQHSNGLKSEPHSGHFSCAKCNHISINIDEFLAHTKVHNTRSLAVENQSNSNFGMQESTFKRAQTTEVISSTRFRKIAPKPVSDKNECFMRHQSKIMSTEPFRNDLEYNSGWYECLQKHKPGQDHQPGPGMENQNPSLIGAKAKDNSVVKSSGFRGNSCSQNVDGVSTLFNATNRADGKESNSVPFPDLVSVKEEAEVFNSTNVEDTDEVFLPDFVPVKEEPEVPMEENCLQTKLEFNGGTTGNFISGNAASDVKMVEQVSSSNSTRTSCGENLSSASAVYSSNNDGSSITLNNKKTTMENQNLCWDANQTVKIEETTPSNFKMEEKHHVVPIDSFTKNDSKAKLLNRNGVFRCSQCSYATFNINQFLNHNDKHQAGKFFVKTIDPFQPSTKVKCTDSLGSRKLSYHCFKCDYRTGNSRDFAYHQKHHHTDCLKSEADAGNFSCAHCNHMSFNIDEFLAHTKVHNTRK